MKTNKIRCTTTKDFRSENNEVSATHVCSTKTVCGQDALWDTLEVAAGEQKLFLSVDKAEKLVACLQAALQSVEERFCTKEEAL